MATFALRGAFTALVTPFTADGSQVDWERYEAHVAAQVEAGIHGLVPCGTTAETPTLNGEEQVELVKRAARVVAGRIPLLVGTGSNDTRKCLETSQAALEAGADAVMIVMPYYNKPTQEGLRRHVQHVARAVDAPVVLYNIPGRASVELGVETALRILDECPNVVGIKDATGNVCRCQELLCRAKDRVTVMSGDDSLTLPFMSVGAQGVISVTSNLYPARIRELVDDVLAGRWLEARQKHFALLPVHRALFTETSPQPIKAALALKGRMTAAVRLPLVEASETCQRELARMMQEYEGEYEGS